MARDDGNILVIDVGATSIKSTVITGDGAAVTPTRRRSTPYPCSPRVLVDALVARIELTDCGRVAVGFPGEFRGGVVIHPGNLARPGGVHTEVNRDLDVSWRGYELTDQLRRRSGRDVRVVNDALLAGFGAITGSGRELVVTLGTGCGLAFFVDGHPVPVRDVGDAVLRDGASFDQLVGEQGRIASSARWGDDVVLALQTLITEFGPTSVHVAGGNSRRLSRHTWAPLDARVEVHGNGVAALGAVRLFP